MLIAAPLVCSTVFAMPEVSIGFFPDVGSSHFLHRLAPGVGLLLGLTGMSLSGAAVFLAGAATHLVRAADVPALRAALQAACRPANNGNDDADNQKRRASDEDDLGLSYSRSQGAERLAAQLSAHTLGGGDGIGADGASVAAAQTRAAPHANAPHAGDPRADATPLRDLLDVDSFLKRYHTAPSADETAQYERLAAVAQRHFAEAQSVTEVLQSLRSAAAAEPLCQTVLDSMQRCALVTLNLRS